MEKKEIKTRKSEFCPSCSRIMMSYVNTMQDFLDKVVEEIEVNTPSMRRDDEVSTRTLARDVSEVRKRLPTRTGQLVKVASSAKSPIHKYSPESQQQHISVTEQSKSEKVSSETTEYQKYETEYENRFAEQSSYETPYSPPVSQEAAPIPSQIEHSESQFQQHSPSIDKHFVSPIVTQSTNVSNNEQLFESGLNQNSTESKISHSYEQTSQQPPHEPSLQPPHEPSLPQPPHEPLPLQPPHEPLPPQPHHEPSPPQLHREPSPPQPYHEPLLQQNHHEPSPQQSHYESTPQYHEYTTDPQFFPLEEPTSPQESFPSQWMEEMLKICDIPLLIPPMYELEAYVTMATNNLTSIGALVLGNSLRLSGTQRTLAILITDDVTEELRNVLSSVFHVVQPISSLEPMGCTKLSMLEQPELGITYSKLLVWRLIQFDKCVFLSPDTLVIQNCDELFERNELSAVPDIGWPDCFNAGVFVYVPSYDTFWDLVNFASTKGSFDGGDQGLLNMYFRSWSMDINKRLPFIYNLMANVSYTYGPAFVRFGGNAKVVHFFGTTKPWNVQFNVTTGEIAPYSGVHPTFSDYVHYWLTIFSHCVLPLFSEAVQEYSTSHGFVNAVDLARIVSGSSETMFAFSPPSFRHYLDVPESVAFPAEKVQSSLLRRVTDDQEESEEEKEEDAVAEAEEDNVEEDSVSDYNRMLAWEQGRMDYLGADSSDNVMKKLDYLIKKGHRPS